MSLVLYMLVLLILCLAIVGQAISPDDRYFHVGCYKEDISHRSLPILLANYSQSDLSNIDKVRNCANAAGLKGYKAFGVQNNGHCWSGINAIFVYAKYGKDSSCTNGTGGVKANDVYFLSFTFFHVGCFNEDPADRAMPVLVANKTTSDPNPIQSCARAAWKKGFTKVFGLQNGGECWSGNNASSTYKKHGEAPGACRNGTGGHLKIEVYLFDMNVPTTSVPQVTVTLPAMITQTTEENNVSNEIYYRYIGCFKDNWTRAMPEALGLKWTKGNISLIKRCAMVTWSKGYQVFGVQWDGRECWSGVNASLTYARYGNSTACSKGIGGAFANDVYAFVCWCMIDN